jgi:hypothetical protein
MLEHVANKKFYQVTVTNHYKQAFQLGQKIAAGKVHNPFFKFYETTLLYPIADGQTGQIIQANAVDWLYRVRAKTIATSYEILADKAVEVSQHYLMLARELLMEQVRLEEFAGGPPSRQTCLFLTDSADEARTWIPLLGGQGLICELLCTGEIQRADSRQLVKDSEPLSVTKDRARKYWKGEANVDPRMETLFEGEAVVSALGL